MEGTHISLIGHWLPDKQINSLNQRNRIDRFYPIKLQNRGYSHGQLEVMPTLLLHMFLTGYSIPGTAGPRC